ncbi:hypothetical protein [Gordonia soli]|uniref:Uncharacterized protein n=1 Tax=Gordonia soli NBRC 108243 TaxID=1223545 RepID=M0QQ56_9ACTN|nr:hypothetical protein [Gordonia soli]GAC69582.1 hypothetical protein GS4_26_00300 [Gordonia soli NBRC 108243]
MTTRTFVVTLSHPQLVERITERLRTTTDPNVRALTVRVAEQAEIDRAASRDRRASAYATRYASQWERKLARTLALADLRQQLVDDTGWQRTRRVRDIAELVMRSGFSVAMLGTYFFVLPAVQLPPSLSAFMPLLVIFGAVMGGAAAICMALRNYVFQRGNRGRAHRAWPILVRQAALNATQPQRSPGTGTQAACAGDLGHQRNQAVQALADLNSEWGRYELDPEAWYLTRPVLHDTTGTVATTVAYNTAMTDLAAAVEDLHEHSPDTDVHRAVDLADHAWIAWHAANDHAVTVGLDDRSPTERAALQRLNTLVARLATSTADDPELAAVKRDIARCLDNIHTVSVSWADITSLPALDRQLVRQLPSANVDLAGRV